MTTDLTQQYSGRIIISVIIDLLNLLKIHIDGPQDQVLEGDALVNILAGGAGDDYVEGKGLADLLSGGTGNDTLGYVSSNAGVNVDLTPNLLGLVTLASGGHATGDVITADFENLIGSNFNDILKGTSAANIIAGLAGNDSIYGRDGNDILIGGAGADYLDGGNGFDIADYSSSAAFIDLTADAAGGWSGTGGDAEGDTLVSIEKITGTTDADTFDGSALTTALTIDGGGGNDTIIGGAGDDTFVVGGGNGGSGLAAAFALDGGGSTVSGGAGNDRIVVGTGVNNVFGGEGNDTLALTNATFIDANTNSPVYHGSFNTGGGTNEVIDFSAVTPSPGIFNLQLNDPTQPAEGEIVIMATAIEYGLIAAGISLAIFLQTEGGVGITEVGGVGITEVGGVGNKFITTSSADNVTGNSLDTALSTLGGNDVLEGKGGADTLDGGAGTDTASYVSSNEGVTVNLSSIGAQTGGHAEGDTLTAIENLIGSGFNDTLTGSVAANDIRGGGGNDTISGGGGNDMLRGGDGRDLLTGGSGSDKFVYTAISGSPAGADATLDRILDFTRGQDQIDLSAFAGTATFVTGSFTGVAGEVRVVASGTSGIDRMELDTNGNGFADLAVLVNDLTGWSAADFVL
ncbi:calcium-binding protein [Phyllobacterium bourgognense]|uniref:Hemolysin type calcium-binding protein n=1 Tax=Phyllobacterium bourgognense TaxID=314236 RepID=A0A368Z143_9HYPH|nr:calcium-binding protein [Phyllobacterium bourgognense]RCW85186.1 hemolysin type calcium-binding protein [Phyllobacterium bourgognense]